MRRSREAARAADAEQVGREYFDLFIGLGRGELLPYGSYYLTGFLHERPLARLRGDLAALGIARAEGNPEPEDHAAILCEIMAGLIGGDFAGAARGPTALFEKHLAPWIGRFFADLERAEAAKFYRASARSAACSSRSRRRLSRCLMRGRCEANATGGDGNEADKRRRRSGRRDFLRALGAGAGLAATAAAPLATGGSSRRERQRQEEGPLQRQQRSHQSVLSRQPLSDQVKEASRADQEDRTRSAPRHLGRRIRRQGRRRVDRRGFLRRAQNRIDELMKLKQIFKLIPETYIDDFVKSNIPELFSE